MNSRKYFIVTLLLLVISSLYLPINVQAEGNVLPVIDTGDDTPEINGTITETEWNNSISFQPTLNGRLIDLRVTSNSTHLFIGFNLTDSGFTRVNDTVPTDPEYSLGYNNQTHDWFALVFDNNLDESGTTSIGNANNPDDAIVIDQYNSTAYDGFANGTENPVFYPDTTISYGSSQINGSSGTLDATVSSTNDTTGTEVSYEIAKPLNSNDTAGHDFSFITSQIVKFKLFSWVNARPNETLEPTFGSVEGSEWYSLRLNETQNGLAIKTPEEAKVGIIGSDLSVNNYDAFRTILESYGFNVQLNNTPLATTPFTSYDLNIIIFEDSGSVTSDGIDALSSYIRSGGNALVFLNSEIAELSKDFAENLDMEFLSNEVLTPINENESRSELQVSTINPSIPFSDDSSLLTDDAVNFVNFTSSALNITEFSNDTNKFVLGQEFMSYNIFESPTDAFYDSSGEGIFNDTENFDGLSLGMALDLLKGGRLALFPSMSLVEDESLVKADNVNFLVKLLPWLGRLTHTLEVHDVEISTNNVRENEPITVTVNVTDGLGEVPSEGVTVLVEAIIGGNVRASVELTQQGDNGTYSGDIVLSRNGFTELQITTQLEGYGFAEGETQNVLIDPIARSFNDLSELSIVLIVLFLISVGSVAIILMRTNKL